MSYEEIKRLMDVLISITALVFLSPVFAVIAVLIKLEDGGRAIYSHERIGQGGQRFRLYKFRSMVENADEILFSDPNLYSQIRSGTHKLKDDPRITKIGRLIRKYSLDELPQFWNVLMGEMSFVGPRAYRPDELERYHEEHPENGKSLALILSVKPGITGLWQVTGRSTVTFDERIEIESSYVKKRCLLTDLGIMLKTPLAVLQAKGAS
ncbi:MAG: sugar transferase [Patescibacteria group bacterium]|nr:sugar transferase [Patescibacteria group bacterium]